MAFTFGGGLGTANSKGTGNTIAITTGATAPAGSLVVVCIGVDNVATSDGDHGEVTSVVDSAGNLYLKAGEHTNGQGTTGGGATVSVWQSVLTAQLSSGGTITVTLGANVGARSAAAGYWTIGKSGVAVAGLATQASDGADTHTDATATIWLTGGTAGQNYTVTNRITTASNPDRIDDRSIVIRVRER